MFSINEVLSNVLHKNNESCCLCLKAIQNEIFNYEDFVTLSLGKSIKICEMLSYIFQNESENFSSVFTKLCSECLNTTITSYEFIKTTLENTQQLYYALEALTTSFLHSNTDFDDCNTLFVSLNMSDYSSQQYRDDTSTISNCNAASKRFNTIVGVQNSMPNIQVDMHVFPFDPVTEEKPNQKQKNLQMYSDMSIIPDNSSLKCKECDKRFNNLFNLRNHFRRIHAPKNYKCDKCDRCYGASGLLERHKSESHCTVVCIECGKSFKNRHTLRMHELGHKYKIICPDCGRSYKNQTNYQKHIKKNICSQETRASPSTGNYKCDYCAKIYTHKETLRAHIQYEHGSYIKINCQYCTKTFTSQSRLKAHVVTHTKEKKFPCEICNGKFVSKMSLVHHTRLHTGEKPYACKYCDQRFLSVTRRSTHIKQYHLNSIQCESCHLKFKSTDYLERHKRMCSNVKPIQGVQIVEIEERNVVNDKHWELDYIQEQGTVNN